MLQTNFTELERVFGGGVVGPEAAPHVTLVLGTNTGTVCTGSLIALDIVLTLARCLFQDYRLQEDAKSVQVVAGVGNLANLSTQIMAQTETVDKIYIHPNFNLSPNDPFFGYNDIALLHLLNPFQVTASVNKIQPGHVEWGLRDEFMCTIAGYGSVNPISPSPEDDLLKMHEVSVTKNCHCYKSLKRNFGNRILRWICIQPDKGPAPCVGSAGAGLVCGGHLVALTAGLIPFTDLGQCIYQHKAVVSCKTETSLTVFLELCPFLRWIHYHFNVIPMGPTNCSFAKPSCSVSRALLTIILGVVCVKFLCVS